ncbi:hypothetical protein AK830_g2573 [Neonectria ditissima]|uniref:NAD(P)-binding domain-containing protein n=1 Tax=Neonectria ditissima TaxID=78410 RepID=A0A0P7BRP5_9HYPO|nr:hypothetical protein AK830_g2573 [Neonectria ditissima]
MSSNTSPTYLITAASGNIGKRLVPLLLSQPSKPTLVLPTSNPDRLASQLQPKADDPHVKIIHGDVQDPIFLESTFKAHHVTAVFLCLTGENELMVTLNFFDAVKQAETVKHLVYLSACGDFDLDAIRAGNLRGNAAGHVLVKPIVEAKLRYGLAESREQPGGFSWTIIGPSLFFGNDLRSKQSILKQGFFDEPLGRAGVSRVDPGDIALAVSNALQDDGKVWAGKKIMIGSLETYSSTAVAKLWSDALGIDVTPAKSDKDGLAAFEELYRPRIKAVWARDLRLMYEWFEIHGFGMTEAEFQDQVTLLGKKPSSYEGFVSKTAEDWKVELD